MTSTPTHPEPSATGTTTATEPDAGLRHLVSTQAAALEAQAAVIAELRQRLDRLDGGSTLPGSPSIAPTDDGDGDPADGRGDEADDGSSATVLRSASTSRRHLLGRGAAAAAGAVLGGAAVGLASASPAAAASGSFDGNPAVAASSTGAGTAVQAGLVGATGAGKAVAASVSSPDAIGVYAESSATTGFTPVVQGTSNSSAGVGVVGVNLAAGGKAYGVAGQSQSDAGIAVWGRQLSATGLVRGVLGETASSVGRGVEGNSTATTGDTNGVLGIVKSTTVGKGVAGVADALTGPNFGVWGLSNSNAGTGVAGAADAASGTTTGVSGFAASPNGTGVAAQALSGTAVSAFSTRTQLRLLGGPTAPLDAGLARQIGEIVLDLNADLWLCVAAGTPGTWRRIAGPATAGAFVALPTPVRVYDSRPGEPPATGPKTPLAANTARTIDLRGNSSGVPTTATAALVTVIGTGATQPGFLTIYKDGIAYPGTSNLVFEGTGSVAGTTITALAGGKCQIRSNVTTNAIIDVLGYYQ